MDMNFSAFQEPRGVMRIFQLLFSICAFATTCNFTGYINFECTVTFKYIIEYPFNVMLTEKLSNTNSANGSCNRTVSVYGDFSSDSRFFVATGVIAGLYCLYAIVLYLKFDELYKKNPQVSKVDFLLTVFISVLWLSSSAAMANALSGLKHVTDPINIHWTDVNDCPKCPISIGSFSTLNIAVILGFLNFFLWAADLWFLYKETSWFQNKQATNAQPDV